MRNRLNSKRGLTLTEIVFSLGILLLVWLTTFEVVILSKLLASMARHKVQSMYVMQRTIEDLRHRPFTNITGSSSTVSIDSKGTPDNNSDDFNGTQIVTVTSPSANYKKVVVELRWNEIIFGQNKTMREYLGTYIANDPQAA